MTQPARRFDLWRRLYTRFLIEPLPAQEGEQPSIATVIMPVTDADVLLRRSNPSSTDSASLAIGRNTYDTIVTVDSSQRLWVTHINVERQSGDNTIDELAVRVPTLAGNVTRIVLERFTATATHVLALPQPFHLDEESEIQIHTSGAGAAATIFRLFLLADLEDLF